MYVFWHTFAIVVTLQKPTGCFLQDSINNRVPPTPSVLKASLVVIFIPMPLLTQGFVLQKSMRSE